MHLLPLGPLLLFFPPIFHFGVATGQHGGGGWRRWFFIYLPGRTIACIATKIQNNNTRAELQQLPNLIIIIIWLEPNLVQLWLELNFSSSARANLIIIIIWVQLEMKFLIIIWLKQNFSSSARANLIIIIIWVQLELKFLIIIWLKLNFSSSARANLTIIAIRVELTIL